MCEKESCLRLWSRITALFPWGYDVEMKGTILQYLENYIEARVQ